MKNKELIDELSKLDPLTDVVVFANGNLYPTLVVDIHEDGRIEIGCGWSELDEDDEEDN